MRKIATTALSLCFISSFAQTQPYSPFVQDPTLRMPTGDVYCLDIAARSGTTLIASNASNLVRDPAPGTQLYLANQEGEAVRIPIEKAFAEARPIAFDVNYGRDYFGRVSPKGTAAVVYTPDGVFAYRQSGRNVRRIFGANYPVGFTSETSAIVARIYAPSVADFPFSPRWYELYWYDLESGALTKLDLTDLPTRLENVRIVDGGKALVYAGAKGISRFDLGTGQATLLPVEPPKTFYWVLDRTGKYIYNVYASGNDGVLERRRLSDGKVSQVKTFTGTGDLVYVSDAVGDRVLLGTSVMLSPKETTFGWDDYLVDAATGEVSLASRRPDGNPVDDLPNYLETSLLSPDGKEVVYVSKGTSFNPLNAPAWKFPYRTAYRQTLEGDPKPLVQAVVGGGSHIGPVLPVSPPRPTVESRDGNFSLTRAIVPKSDYGRLLLRDLRTKEDSEVILDSPTNPCWPSDVSHEGRYAAYFRPGDPIGVGEKSHLWVYDTVEGRERCATARLGNNRIASYGRFDTAGNLHFVADASGLPTGQTGNWLFRYDPVADVLTPLQPAAITADRPDISVGGGWVAYPSGERGAYKVVVVNTATGVPTTVAVPGYPNLTLGTITSDGKTIGISYQGSADGSGTILADLPTGVEKARLPGGQLTKDCQWLVGGDAIYISTGAAFTVSPRFATLGGGPEATAFSLNGGFPRSSPSMETNDRGYDAFRYQVGVPTSPVLYSTNVATSGNGVWVQASVLAAGLRKTKTWIEYRLDGGDWKRLPAPGPLRGATQIAAPDGTSLVELRGRNGLGRTSEIQAFPVWVDRIKPTVTKASVVVNGTTATVRFALSEIAAVQINYGVGNFDTKVSADLLPGTNEQTISGLKAGKTYSLRIEAIDFQGNVGASKDLTFTTGS